MERVDRLLSLGRIAHASRTIIRHLRRSLPRVERADLLSRLGEAQNIAGRYAAAQASFVAARRLYLQEGEAVQAAAAARRAGDCARQRDRFALARRWYSSSITDLRAAPRRLSDAVGSGCLDAETGIALTLRAEGRFHAAVEAFRRLEEIYRAKKDIEGRAFSLWALGTTRRFQGRLKEAERALRQSITLTQKTGDAGGLAYAWCALGGTLRMRGDAVRSGALYRKAWPVFQKSGDRFGASYALCGQGNAARMRGRLKSARSFFRRAEQGYRRLHQTGPLGFVLWSVALLDLADGRAGAARRRLTEAGRCFRRTGDPRGLVYTLLGRGELGRINGRPGARTSFRQAATHAKRLGMGLEMAHAHCRLTSFSAARSAYRACGVRLPLFSRYPSLP